MSKAIWLITILALFFALELVLRLKWGFGTMLLYREDPDFEYIAQPNQSINRLGNDILYNEQSMRSDAVKADKGEIILGFGDSVINGGTQTDQDSLATTLLGNALGDNFQVLNISAGSWGPDNCAAYLNKFGDFNARLMLLVVSSHDAHDNMQFEKIVGNHPSYPEKQYLLATWEVMDRYLIPRLKGLVGKTEEDNLMINKDGAGFNSGFEYFNNYSKQHNIPLLVYLHAERQEVLDGKFNAEGQEIIRFCQQNNIRLISGLDAGEKTDMYIDQIHFNSSGQKMLASALLKPLKELMQVSR